ncbi:transposase [Enterococcus sp. DIV0187]
MDNGIARIERTSFDAYNESEVLVSAIRHHHDRHDCYPKRVLADKIYRNRKNLTYCKDRGIRLSGPALGRSKKNEIRDKTIVYQDNADRVEVERGFSLLKRCFSVGLIRTKRKDTTLTSIALSVIAINLSKLTADFLRLIFIWSLNFRRLGAKLLNFVIYENLAIIQYQ